MRATSWNALAKTPARRAKRATSWLMLIPKRERERERGRERERAATLITSSVFLSPIPRFFSEAPFLSKMKSSWDLPVTTSIMPLLTALLLMSALVPLVPAVPQAGRWTLNFNASHEFAGLAKNAFNGSSLSVRIECSYKNKFAGSNTVKVGWILRETQVNFLLPTTFVTAMLRLRSLSRSFMTFSVNACSVTKICLRMLWTVLDLWSKNYERGESEVSSLSVHSSAPMALTELRWVLFGKEEVFHRTGFKQNLPELWLLKVSTVSH